MYTTNDVDREDPLNEKIPGECLGVLNHLLDKNLISRLPDQLTVNQYKPGQGLFENICSSVSEFSNMKFAKPMIQFH